MNDMHVHSLCSADSAEPMDTYLPQARALGVEYLCFTDHVDCNPNDMGYGYYDVEGYFEALHALDTAGVHVLSGMEFGEPHRYPQAFAKLCELPYDFVMGSVHFCDFTPDLFFSGLMMNGVTVQQCYSAYWQQVRMCVEFGGFDVLGHIDIPKRYYKELVYDPDELRGIFRIMLKNGIIPEINTSSLSRGCDEPMPGRELLELYKAEGGLYVTVGSDAHSVDALGAHNAYAQALIRSVGLREVVFVKREMVLL